MPNNIVPANAIALPSILRMHGRIPIDALATTSLLSEEDFVQRLSRANDFEADDSGAIQHVIADDPHETFIVAFQGLTAAPWSFDRHDIGRLPANPL